MSATTGGAAARDTADVVVIGGGGSGLAAAIEAASLGRSVILLEKAEAIGGSTGWSVGSLSASHTPHQVAKGIKDSPELHWEDMPKFAARLKADDNPALRWILTWNIAETVRWLTDLGVAFFGPMPEPPHRQPRMHLVVPGSRAYIHHCGRRARRLGVDIRTGMRAHTFIVENDRVTGVVATGPGGREVSFRAAGAVVLASGDYSASPDMKRRFISAGAASVQPVNRNNTGDGQRMGEDIGGVVLNGHVATVSLRFVPPRRQALAQMLPPTRLLGWALRMALDHLPPRLIRPFVMSFLVTALSPASAQMVEAGAILVNKHGVPMRGDQKDIVATFLDQPEHRGFLLFDDDFAHQFDQWPNAISTAPGVAYAYFSDYRRSRPDLCHSNGDVAALARSAGMDETALAGAVAALAERRQAVGKPPLKPPFHLLGPADLYITTTDGGLAVDETLRVLRADGSPIAGLFAAGSAGQGGLLLQGHGHHIGWAFTSGRIAGRNAASEVLSDPVGV